MPSATIDLQKAIDDARRRRAEIKNLHDDPPATDPAERERQRDLLEDPLTALDEQILALEAVRDEKNAAKVVVDGVTPEEVKAIDDALKALDTVIRRTETFQADLALATAALGAARKIAGAGARGTAA